MAFTNAEWLPTYEELTVPEINMTSAPLRAGAHHFGKYCDEQCKEFMLCNSEQRDPRKCLNEGKEVTRCGIEFFNKVKDSCLEEFNQYWKCVDSNHEMNLSYCRSTQAVFDKCIFEKLGQERPELGYFSKTRVHKTVRPKPKPYSDLPMPAETPGPPKNIDDMETPAITKERRGGFLGIWN
ncbi:hypothetical protein CAPTEDRAFT_226933 [Capitella teleta]|uniref:NADH dehydrogenase [ubiquinone] 1 alpha subcomplex subunit 8 n=1 Tax=Capitella teleta TaxID=283909 RepID=R7U9S5_CAPTE|nr:hypothetical protein CAPTEDRAFT_226933 [Capitella teleta]|eukprot:ELT99860.1 hypothetical protein CAPTEDRAFT_226933 [Capitella teleta]